MIWETARVQIPVIRRHFQHQSLDSERTELSLWVSRHVAVGLHPLSLVFA
jgi:hypothetical protein